jgi:hypothetical protein
LIEQAPASRASAWRVRPSAGRTATHGLRPAQLSGLWRGGRPLASEALALRPTGAVQLRARLATQVQRDAGRAEAQVGRPMCHRFFLFFSFFSFASLFV